MTKRNRRSIRLKDYDYSQPGSYFVTICTKDKLPWLGEVINGQMQLSAAGQIVADEWHKTDEIRANVTIDEWVIMPNHLHGIIEITYSPVGAFRRNAPTHRNAPAPATHQPTDVDMPRQVVVGATRWVAPTTMGLQANSLGAIIGQIKSICTKRIRRAGMPDFAWQRNYYEHIIRSERALHAIRQYIQQNPLRWQLDRYNPAATGRDPQAVELWQLLQEPSGGITDDSA
ncbi:MAG: transposase [Anaerolineae bacterium]|nr:transposase [Anaerolineae bacterium]